MPPADSNAWERVGHLLAGRRVQISPRYANRRTFAAERGMNWRTLHDIEHAKRDNFKPETMRAFETAYALVPGSLDHTLAGGELEPLPDVPRLAPVSAPPAHDGHDGGRADDASPEAVAETLLAGYVAQYGDGDRILRMLASRPGAAAVTRLEEVLAWLRVNSGGGERNGTVG